MAILKQRLALPRKPFDWRITRLCFLDANPRVAKLPLPIKFTHGDADEGEIDGNMAGGVLCVMEFADGNTA